MILQGLKTRLGKAKGQWVEELPNVLWAYRTTARAGNGCTPFSLVYGLEAVLPPKIGLPTYRISTFEPAMNDTELLARRATRNGLITKRKDSFLRKVMDQITPQNQVPYLELYAKTCDVSFNHLLYVLTMHSAGIFVEENAHQVDSIASCHGSW
ncbi:retrovirus-related pol polyprotein from transposon opus [Tanacetum coccineum]